MPMPRKLITATPIYILYFQFNNRECIIPLEGQLWEERERLRLLVLELTDDGQEQYE
jgi:hypothetical protein